METCIYILKGSREWQPSILSILFQKIKGFFLFFQETGTAVFFLNESIVLYITSREWNSSLPLKVSIGVMFPQSSCGERNVTMLQLMWLWASIQDSSLTQISCVSVLTYIYTHTDTYMYIYTYRHIQRYAVFMYTHTHVRENISEPLLFLTKQGRSWWTFTGKPKALILKCFLLNCRKHLPKAAGKRCLIPADITNASSILYPWKNGSKMSLQPTTENVEAGENQNRDWNLRQFSWTKLNSI